MMRALDTQLSTSDFFVTCSSLLICAPGKAGHDAPQEEAWWQVPTAGPTARRGATVSGANGVRIAENRTCARMRQPLKIEQFGRIGQPAEFEEVHGGPLGPAKLVQLS